MSVSFRASWTIQGTYSSAGYQTSTANQVITFANPVISLWIGGQTSSDVFYIKINDESTTHLVSYDKPFSIEGMRITSITIVTAGKNYMYDAGYIVE